MVEHDSDEQDRLLGLDGLLGLDAVDLLLGERLVQDEDGPDWLLVLVVDVVDVVDVVEDLDDGDEGDDGDDTEDLLLGLDGELGVLWDEGLL